MPDREPEPWESGAAAPFLWIETAQGNVEVWALGEDRFRITAPGGHEPALRRRSGRRTRWPSGSGRRSP
jgi:hypothetical protein